MRGRGAGKRWALWVIVAVWLLHVRVSEARAQVQVGESQPAAAGSAAPGATFQSPPSTPSTPGTPRWKPKRFPRLYPGGRVMRPMAQTRDTERAPSDDTDREERDSGLLIAGATTLVLSYVLTVGIAATVVGPLHQEDCDAGDTTRGCRDSTLMMIPLVGPMLTTSSGSKALFAVLSLTQVTGLVLTLAGISKYASGRKSQRSWASNHALQIYAGPLQGGAFAATRVAF